MRRYFQWGEKLFAEIYRSCGEYKINVNVTDEFGGQRRRAFIQWIRRIWYSWSAIIENRRGKLKTKAQITPYLCEGCHIKSLLILTGEGVIVTLTIHIIALVQLPGWVCCESVIWILVFFQGFNGNSSMVWDCFCYA